MLTCKDFPTDTCCNSCHYDEEDGYGDLCEGALSDGREYIVCCAVWTWIQKNPGFLPKQQLSE